MAVPSSRSTRLCFLPVAYRKDYLLSLKALSQTDRPNPSLRMLDRAQAFSSSIAFDDFEEAIRRLHLARAFDTSEDALLRD